MKKLTESTKINNYRLPVRQKIIFGLLYFLLLGAVGFGTYTLKHQVILKSSGCEKFSKQLLANNESKYSFKRCEEKTYQAVGGNPLTRIYVVAGEPPQDKSEEQFECNNPEITRFNCEIHIGWISDSKFIDFIDEPVFITADPAVSTLGCVQSNVSSDTDVKAVPPVLVFQDNKYWWKTDYNDTATDQKSPVCRISGTSLIGYGEGKLEVKSSVRANYLINIDACATDKSSACQTAKALKTGSIEPCKYNEATYEGYDGISLGSPPMPTGSKPALSFECVTNFVSQTGDLSACNKEADYGKIECDSLVKIVKL